MSTASPPVSSNLQNVLEDIASRFVCNLPEEELQSFERLFIQLEQAHWFYADNFAGTQSLPKMNMKQFALTLFNNVSFLKPHASKFEQLFAQFRDYVGQVPVCGAILINAAMDSVLLVRPYKGNTWSFPKGKINQGESPSACAVREVKEEVGFDASALINPNDFIEIKMESGKSMTLFLISNIPEDFEFATQTKFEISDIKWFNIYSDLPRGSMQETKTKFWMVAPFCKQLRLWIRNKKGFSVKKNNRNAGSYDRANQLSNIGIPSPVYSDPQVSTSLPSSPTRPNNAHPRNRRNQHNVHSGYHQQQSSNYSGTPTRGRGSSSRNQSYGSSTSSGSAIPRYDDVLTFGANSNNGWSAEDMFAENERRFGVRSTVVPQEDFGYVPFIRLAAANSAAAISTSFPLANQPQIASPSSPSSTASVPASSDLSGTSAPPATSEFSFNVDDIVSPFQSIRRNNRIQISTA